MSRGKYKYWLPSALEISTSPTKGAVGFFNRNQANETECYAYHPSYTYLPSYPYPSNADMGAAWLVVFSLPISLLIAVVTLPIAAFHDLFAGILNFLTKQSEEENNTTLVMA